MAFKQPGANFYGFQTDVYVKISQILVAETGVDEEGKKLYSATALVTWYTDETKSYQFNQTQEAVTGLHIEETTIPGVYAKLAESEKFKDFVNA